MFTKINLIKHMSTFCTLGEEKVMFKSNKLDNKTII